VNIVYGVITRGSHFNDHPSELPNQVASLPRLSQSPAMAHGMPRRTIGEGRTVAAFAAIDPTDLIPWSAKVETAVVILRSFNALLGGLTDMMFAGNPQKPEEWRSSLVVINGFIGAASAILVGGSMSPALAKWMKDENYSGDAKLDEVLQYAALATGAFPFVYKVLEKVYATVIGVNPESADAVECTSLLVNGIAIYAGIGATICRAAGFGTRSSEALAAYWMFQISQIWQSITQADACLYTQAGAQGRPPESYEELAKIHAGLRAASIVVQTATAEMLINR